MTGMMAISFVKALANNLRNNWPGLLLAGLGLVPLLVFHFEELWMRPAYQFFPFVLGGALLLAWRNATELDQPMISGNNLVLRILGGVTTVFYLVGIVLNSPWLGMMTLLLALAMLFWACGGKKVLRAFLPVIVILLAITPPPLGWDDKFMVWLRSEVMTVSSRFLDLMSIVHVLEGNTILLPGKVLLVEEACSGINSIILCNTLCLFYTFWKGRPAAWLLITLPATCVFVILGNILRITGGAALDYYQKCDVLSGRPHEIFGLLLLVVYCGLIWSLDEFMLFLSSSSFHREAEDDSLVADSPALAGNQPLAPARALVSKGTGCILGIMGIVAFGAHLSRGEFHNVAALPNLGAPKDIHLSLPENISGWQQTSSETATNMIAEIEGVRSVIWHFQQGDRAAVVAVDYPLEGFHNVRSCYSANGWQIASEERLPLRGSGDSMNVFKLVMERSSYQHAVVFHAVINEHGRWLLPPERKDAFSARLFGNDPAVYQPSYRIQVLSESYTALSAADLVDAQDLFYTAAKLLSGQLRDCFRGTSSK
jgi:exosortase